MGRNKQTQLLQLLEECVQSKPVLQVEKFGLWVSQNVQSRYVSSLGLSEPRCPGPASGFMLVIQLPLSTKPDDIVSCHVHIARYVISLYIPVTVLANYR